jgi:hypothetical protein
MKAKALLLASTMAGLSLAAGCDSMSNTAAGGLIGGGAGAGLGAAVGGGKGALVGGLLGGATGLLVGNSVDQKEKQQKDIELAQARAAAAQGQGLGITDVINLTRTGTPEGVIINQIRSTNSVFLLSPADLTLLQQNGVSPNVIMEMQAHRPAPQPVIVTRPAPVYYYAAPPPPPPVVTGAVFIR